MRAALTIAALISTVASSLADEVIVVPGVGAGPVHGAGVALTEVNGNIRPDLILMAYFNPAGGCAFKYRVAFDLGGEGEPTGSWSGVMSAPGVCFLGGGDAQGAGVALTGLDRDPAPDMFLMAYFAPTGGDPSGAFRYRVGHNVRSSGVVAQTGAAALWGDVIQVLGFGPAQGADIVITNIDQDIRRDMILIAYQRPPDAGFRYRVGFNLDEFGRAQSWSGMISVREIGISSQGAGAAVTHLNTDRRPELVLMSYDNPPGANSFHYIVGENLNVTGVAEAWNTRVPWPPRPYDTGPGVGSEAGGAGLAIGCVDGNAFRDAIFMAYDTPTGAAATFRYRKYSEWGVWPAQCTFE